MTAISFAWLITDELVNMLAGFQEEVAAINWGGQHAIATQKDLCVYENGANRSGMLVGTISHYDGRYMPAKRPPHYLADNADRVKYPTTFANMIEELQQIGYSRAHIRQATNWVWNGPLADDSVMTQTTRSKVLQFLVDNNAPRGE